MASSSTLKVLSHRTSHSSPSIEAKKVPTHWSDPTQRQYKFWNRESSVKGTYSYLLDISPESVQREAKIISLADPNEAADESLHHGKLPLSTTLLGVGTSLQDFEHLRDQEPNIIFMCPSCPRAAAQLPLVLAAFPSIEWVHCRSAGIDFVESEELQELCSQRDIRITNAKGQFSSSLAEYVMMACSYFAKDLPRLMAQQKARKWDNYDVEELRGKTMGIVGFGDIGRACARLANVFGMRVVALRRHPFLSKDDPLCDVVYGTDKKSLNTLMSESDYIVCSAPSTTETRGMVNADAFAAVKKNAVFINLGRGPVVDEKALIASLKSGQLKGAALVCLLTQILALLMRGFNFAKLSHAYFLLCLFSTCLFSLQDVFIEEPLPESNELWDLPNILISPHNMDQTSTFMHEATEFFIKENIPRFLCNEDLLNPVDPFLGY